MKVPAMKEPSEIEGGSILVLNAGSSSLKFAVFAAEDDAGAMLRGEVSGLGGAPRLVARDRNGNEVSDRSWTGKQDFGTILHELLGLVDAQPGHDGVVAVGHRVVHGGAVFAAPCLVTPAVLDELDALVPLDPIHMPLNIAPMREIAASHGRLRQVACFDTAFHRTMPAVAKRFALPRALEDEGVLRYGFHGLSYEYIARCLAKDVPDLANGRVIVAHLGSGASLCAMSRGASVATTMGFSALDGLVMATRCGSLDPGVILYLGRQGRSFSQIEELLYRHSGLLGVSGTSGDIKVLLESGEPHARDAVELFNYRLACEAGALASALGGVDGVVFTGGIGEHSVSTRSDVCRRLAWLGIELDAAANAAGAKRISAQGSRIAVLVVPTDEEAMIASHVRAVLCAGTT